MAARKSPLTVVKPGESPDRPAKPKTLAEAVEGGVYLEILVAQRREIAQALPGEKGPAKAALHRQLSILAKEIAALELAASEEAAENDVTPDEAFDAEAL
jgi:hypothetical protein